MYLDSRALDAAGVENKVLRESYEFCRRLLITMDGRSFWAANLLLPPRKRPHMCAIYGLARYADQIVDSGDPRHRAEEFETWSSRLLADLRSGVGGDPIGRALGHTMRTWGIALADIEALLAGMRMDLTITEYATYADLDRYLETLNGSIARLILPIMEPVDPRAEQHTVATSKAAQLTNFIRDIGKDHRRLGRCYLPLEDLERFGVPRSDLGERSTSPALRELVRFQIARAREMWALGSAGVEYLPASSRPASRLATALYSGILDEIERRDHEVLDTRARVSTRRKAALVLREYLPAPRPMAA
ncbi:phytoene/squalene synthase family protein [Crossiella cryophila]|uniref:Phytoene synthase n=1 Tax=Crossiella cryophila TaxID=43355 RepID=A0A7W7CEH5_9PSEU|nr:phytoene/squalene synthase family protein [Crossiella cryophila]MBB4678049.1 phytoene synthase [Crossiella cryophila]